MNPVVLVTGFEPFGAHGTNPSAALATALDGARWGGLAARSAILPVHHTEACARVRSLLHDLEPAAVLHLGLAEGRARLALERVALNVMDFSIPDNAGAIVSDAPCVAGGPAAYASTLPLRPLLAALTAAGIPAYLSNTAGTYLCNQTLYTTLHEIASRGLATRAGFLHLPLVPAMVAAAGVDQPSMDFATMLRAAEILLREIAYALAPAPGTAAASPAGISKT